MAKRIKRTQIVDAASGEVLQEHRETLFSSDAYIPGKGYRLYSRKHKRLGKWDKPLHIHAKGLLYDAICTMDEENVMAPVAEFIGRTGLKRRRVYEVLAELKEAGAIAKVGSAYVVNPAIAFAGTYLPQWLYKLYKVDLQKAVPMWAQALYEQEGTKQ